MKLYPMLFKLHGWLGISVGLVVAVIGLTGATLAFEDELQTVLSPGVVTVAPRSGARLSPDQLVAATVAFQPGARVAQLVIERDPGKAVKATFAPLKKGARGATTYIDPYDGRLLGPAVGEAFFDTVEDVHRWLALPGHANGAGRILTGITAIILIFFALTGLYLRWPRTPLDWRQWLVLDLRRGGRVTLYRTLHRVIGGWLFAFYLFSALTGLWWSFDWYQQGVRFALTGKTELAAKKDTARPGAMPRLAPAWASFLASDGARFDRVTILVPPGKGAIRMRVLQQGARFDRMTDDLSFDERSGVPIKIDRFAKRASGTTIATSFHAFHTGAYFGLIGRIVLFVSSATLPLFAVTGVLLFLGRQQRKRKNRRQISNPHLLTTPHHHLRVDPELTA